MRKNLLIYLTAFFCGMSVMAVELSASRLLAPYFGTSQIVWTVIIGLIMISLSLGNVLGGRLADKYNDIGKLYSRIWFACIWIAIIPLVAKYVIAGSVVGLMWVLPNNLLVAGSIISCLIIFSFPLVLLGMASPVLVKLGVSDMESAGRTTGKIYALNTIGSIIGTFIPTFLTIPVVGTSKTFLIFALILNLLVLYYSVRNKIRIIRTAITAAVILALCFIPFNTSYAFWKNNIVVEDESLYNYLQVAEDKDSVILSTNVAFGVQSIYKKNHEMTGFYYDYALMAPYFAKATDQNKKFNVLVLGMGTGTYAKQTKHFFPNSSIEGVEIDQKIVDLSKKYFELSDQEAKVYVNDGRTFLSSNDAKKYDIIMVDAYHDITIPFHMSTKEFFKDVKDHLNPGGIMVMNINIRSKGSTDISNYLEETVRSVMSKVYKCDIENGTNTIVFASDDTSMSSNFIENISKIDSSSSLKKVSEYVKNSMSEITASKHVFTDELAPVEIMGQKALDEIVANELAYYKETIKSSKNGIWDLFNMLSE